MRLKKQALKKNYVVVGSPRFLVYNESGTERKN